MDVLTTKGSKPLNRDKKRLNWNSRRAHHNILISISSIPRHFIKTIDLPGVCVNDTSDHAPLSAQQRAISLRITCDTDDYKTGPQTSGTEAQWNRQSFRWWKYTVEQNATVAKAKSRVRDKSQLKWFFREIHHNVATNLFFDTPIYRVTLTITADTTQAVSSMRR